MEERRARSPLVLVPADQLEEARALAGRPIPPDIVEASIAAEAEPEPFLLPDCPACGAGDPFLEAVNPSNLWRCGACGRVWHEAGEEEETPAGESVRRPE